jgi:hypothetical protein
MTQRCAGLLMFQRDDPCNTFGANVCVRAIGVLALSLTLKSCVIHRLESFDTASVNGFINPILLGDVILLGWKPHKAVLTTPSC